MVTAKKLSNGISVVMEPMPAVSSTAIGVWVRTGAVDEMPEYAGISHFVEHMMFKGTETRSALDIARAAEAIGAQMNAFTGKEATCYYFKSIDRSWKTAADVICDMIEHSVFDREELDRERKVIEEEISMDEDLPDDLAHDGLLGLLYRGKPLANSITGTRSSLKRITRNVIRRYVREQYVRSAIVVSAAGSFDPDDLCRWFEARFSELGQDKPERPPAEGAYEPAYHARKKDVQQSHLCIGRPGIPLNDEQVYACQILNNVIGGGMSSRLFQNIRERRGLAYSVFSGLERFRGDSYFEIYAGVRHDNIGTAAAAVREELDRLKNEPVPQEELDSSREQIKSSYVFSCESTSSRMIANGRNYLLHGETHQRDRVMAGYDAVTIDDLERVKPLFCDFEHFSASAVSARRIDLRRIMK